MAEMKNNIFISYAHADNENNIINNFIQKLRNELSSKNFEVWSDSTSLKSGESVYDQILNSLHKSNIIILLVSPAYLSSEWANFEMGNIINRYKHGDVIVIPLIIKDMNIKSLYKSILEMKTIECPYFSTSYNEIADKLKLVLEKIDLYKSRSKLLSEDNFIYNENSICYDKNFAICDYQKTTSPEINLLTEREKEILTLLALGHSNSEISNKLSISINTVKTHAYKIFKKINVPNRFQAALWAAKYLT